MTHNELKQKHLSTDYGTVTPSYTSDTPLPILNSKGQITDYDLPNFVLIKTAQEVYDEWVYNRDNPPKTEPTTEEKLRADIEYLSAMTGVTL